MSEIGTTALGHHLERNFGDDLLNVQKIVRDVNELINRMIISHHLNPTGIFQLVLNRSSVGKNKKKVCGLLFLVFGDTAIDRKWVEFMKQQRKCLILRVKSNGSREFLSIG